jgi:hypothetical protein
MRSCGTVVRNERGVAMIVALLILFVIGVLAAMLTMSSVTHSRLSGVEQRRAKALDLAEAGISEAVSRIKAGDVPGALLTNNPKMVAQIYTVASGSVPVLGTDSTGLATAQPVGSWLNYSLSGRGADALTVTYKTNAARTLIYKYDPARNPPVQTLSGYPIFEIKSVGRVGTTVRRVMTDVVPTPFVINVKGALASGVGVKFVGTAQACGYDHRVDTPSNTGVSGRTGAGGCNEDPSINHWETGAGGSGDLTGVWSGGNIQGGGGSQSAGTPPQAENQLGFYTGPWDALGMTQAQFYAWAGVRQTTVPGNLDGIVYLDDNTTTQDQSGDYTVHGSGSGMLYVDGNLTVNAGFTYRGLLYIEGDLKLNGNAWILGGLIVRGETETKFTGGATVLYSADAIKQNISRYGGSYANLTWREY